MFCSLGQTVNSNGCGYFIKTAKAAGMRDLGKMSWRQVEPIEEELGNRPGQRTDLHSMDRKSEDVSVRFFWGAELAALENS